jgi:hypothetical protein
MAWSGQTAAHSGSSENPRHSTHSRGSIQKNGGAAKMAAAGQTPTHWPQPLHRSVI